MDDPKITPVPQGPEVESDTTQPEAVNQAAKETAQAQKPVVQQPTERTIPYSRYKQTNDRLRELERELAGYKSKANAPQGDPDDLAKVMSHPFVQDLLVKEAKRELTDYAREVVDKYPNFPAAVKKAVLTNVRGFIKESTTDVETAKLDILDYIEGLVSELETGQPTDRKPFPVAATNATQTKTSSLPAEVAKILKKSPDEWTDEDMKKIEDYKQTQQ